MSRDRRRNAATATVGLAGVAGAGALRHSALVDAYKEKTDSPIKRPRLWAERRFLKHPKGRAKFVTGLALGTAAIPPAAVGTQRLMSKRDRHTFLEEGLIGARDSIRQRNETFKERPPAKLALGNYAAGAAVGSGAGALIHHRLGKTKFPGTGRSAAASAAGVLAGAATLPLQSKITQRVSNGKYEVTPTGVRRKRQKAVPASSKAGLGGNVSKIALRTHGPSVRAGYAAALPKSKSGRLVNEVGARVGAHWTTKLSRVAEAVEHHPGKHVPPPKRRTKLVATGRNKAGETIRAISYDVSSINDKDKLIREVATGQGRLAMAKADIGAELTRGQRRARVTASGGPPVIGDFTSAAMAARLSPEKYRLRSATQQYAGSQGGGAVGNVAGAAGALALARHSPGFQRAADRASDRVDDAKDVVRRKVGLKPATRGPSRTMTALSAHPRAPKLVRSGAKAIARNPKVAAIGALTGGGIGSTLGGQAAYGHIMNRDDRYRKANPSATHGSRKVTKADKPKPLSQRETKQLSRRKEHSAAMSMIGGATGLAALGSTLGAKGLRTRAGRQLVHPRRALATARRLEKVPVPALTLGAGLGGINAFTNAAIQHKEAKQTLAKALGAPVLPGLRRAKSMRRGYLRQTRSSTGATLVSTVRGGLG